MRRLTVATVSVAASLALAACAERDSTSPRSINPGQASFAGGPNSTACDFTNITKAAKNYFTSNQDPVYDLISTWSNAYKTGSAASANHYGWDVLTVVQNERLTSSTTDGSFGAVFVVMTTRCMVDESNSGAQLQLPSTLTANSNALLARVLNSGIWEIRTGGAPGGPAAGKNKQGGLRAVEIPQWGVETAGPNWPGSMTYAVVGYPFKDTNPLLINQPQIDPTDDLQTDYGTAWPFNAFELATVPAGAVVDHSSLRVGICVDGDPTAGDGSYNFLVHNNSELLPNSTPTSLCTYTTASLGNGPWYTRLAHGAARFFGVGTLYAQDDSRDFIGGLPSGWSPMEGGQLDASQITLTITTQPKNNISDSTDNSLVVTATVTGTSDPVPGVAITGLTVLNNQGSPAGAVIVDGSTNLPQTTDKDGKATVHFQIGKPGAYYIVVVSNLDSGAISSPTSVKFNVKN